MKPYAAFVDVVKVDCAMRYSVVEPESFRMYGTIGASIADPALAVNGSRVVLPRFTLTNVADVWLIPAIVLDWTVVPAGDVLTCPHTSHEPAVRLIDVTFAGVPLVSATDDGCRTMLDIVSPMLPACAESLVDVPLMPIVLLGVMSPVAESVVNAPAAGVVAPIDGGDANRFVIPVPLTVLLADKVVNAPLPAVVEPIDPGEANVAPPSVAALIDELHVNPVPLVHPSALVDALQLGIANAAGDALDAVTFASTLFAAIAASDVADTLPHAGADEAPVETIACPAAEPVGFRSWTGASVAASRLADARALVKKASSFFMYQSP